jgi:SAM-dependent methyltransferase
VLATDADPAMLARAVSGGADVRFVAAVAERIPLDDGSVDLVTAAQAFHWFNPPIALAEFARLLKPGGGLALVWNDRDAAQSAFLRAYDALIQEFNPAYRREYRTQDWAAKIEQSGRFRDVRHWTHVRPWRLEFDAFVAYTRTVSYLRNVLPAEARAEFENRLRELMRGMFSGSICEFPLRTKAWLAVRDEAGQHDGC